MSSGSAREPVHEGLLGTTAQGQPVALRYEDRTAHTAVIGKSGFGKTTLLEHLILDDLRVGTSAIVIDAQGDLTKRLVGIASGEAQERLCLVEMSTDRPVGLNLFDTVSGDSAAVDRTVANVVALFKKLFEDEHRAAFRPVIEAGVRNSAYLAIANGYTLTEVDRLFTDASFRARALRATKKETVVSYWRQYDACTPRERRERSEPVLTRVDALLSTDSVRLMVGQARTTVPFDEVLNGGGTLLFNLGGAQLGGEQVSFLGMLLLAVLSNRIELRAGQPIETRQRVHLYLDEYGRFATSTTERMLAEFRKFGLGLTVGYQTLSQTADRPPNVASLVMFQLDGHDAPKMAMHLDTTPRRTKVVVKPRTEPQYQEEKVDRWESPEDEGEYARLQRRAVALRSDLTGLRGKVASIGVLTERRHTESPAMKRMCDCCPEGWVWAGGDFMGERPPKTSVSDVYELHRLFNPSRYYFLGIGRPNHRNEPLFTASGFVGIFDVEEEGPPGQRDSLVRSRCERYFLRPEAAEASWLAVAVQGYAQDSRAVLSKKDHAKPLAAKVIKKLKELYQTTPFHFRLEPGTPSMGCERSGRDWMKGHWVTATFPSLVEELRTSFTDLRQRMNEVDKELASVEARAKKLYAAHRTPQVMRTYLGHKQVVEEVSKMRARDQYVHGHKVKVEQEMTQREVWYDSVEELDQTHADRGAELATELASLPKFVAYCKLLDAHGNPHEYRVATRPPARSVEARTTGGVVRRSREQYGTPRWVVEADIDARQQSPDDVGPPPIGRRT